MIPIRDQSRTNAEIEVCLWLKKGYSISIASLLGGHPVALDSPSRIQLRTLFTSAPAQFGGIEGRWTPEELLLAAAAGCFTTTLRSIASSIQADFTDLEVEASATLRKMESGYTFSEIVIRPTLKISDDGERGFALDLLKKAQRLCLVSRALAIPTRFEPQLEVAAALSSVP